MCQEPLLYVMGERDMNQLLEKFNEYKTFVNYKMVYEFENEDVLEFKFKQSDFPHLIGLHKLIDIPIIKLTLKP